MNKEYEIQNELCLPFSISILVSNYHALNRVVNLPVVKDSDLLRGENIGGNNIGIWKIKKLKNNKS